MASSPATRRATRGGLLASVVTATCALAIVGASVPAPTAATGSALAPTAANTLADRLAGFAQPHPTFAPAPPAPVAPAPAVVRAVAPVAHVTVAPAAARPVSHPAAPVAVDYRNRLVSADGALNTGVGYYSDCSGRTPLTHASAAIDTCVGGRTYFVGHNPGVFTPLFDEGVGSIITWYDGAGNAHRLRIIAVRNWNRSAGVPSLMSGAVAQFQTCVTADGSVERILDAAPA